MVGPTFGYRGFDAPKQRVLLRPGAYDIALNLSLNFYTQWRVLLQFHQINGTNIPGRYAALRPRNIGGPVLAEVRPDHFRFVPHRAEAAAIYRGWLINWTALRGAACEPAAAREASPRRAGGACGSRSYCNCRRALASACSSRLPDGVPRNAREGNPSAKEAAEWSRKKNGKKGNRRSARQGAMRSGA